MYVRIMCHKARVYILGEVAKLGIFKYNNDD